MYFINICVFFIEIAGNKVSRVFFHYMYITIFQHTGRIFIPCYAFYKYMSRTDFLTICIYIYIYTNSQKICINLYIYTYVYID